ncbi:hypothetical protein BJ912DRAFT_967389 [Pholiota molesta]|nr:hypothetical protein BJ912DRAFT_967389 [Pholiota molesta]
MYMTDRKSSYKLPPTTIRDKLVSQEARRSKALEEQKRRRAQKIDSSRQLDLFADLSLAEHSDEDAQAGEETINDDDGTSTQPGLTSVAAYASLLQRTDLEEMKETTPQSDIFASSSTSQYPYHQPEASTSTSTSYPLSSPNEPNLNPIDQLDDSSTAAPTEPKKTRKRGGKNSHKRRAEANKASHSTKYKGSSKWADKCMYAELLEMNADDVWSGAGDMGYDEHGHVEQAVHDGLPRDLESGWVAVAPVPKGKRCLVVTQQSAGVAGVVPNTTLRSRLLGKSLLARFPSTLPHLTVLDCILDENWRENGILHVLDVVRWKGQDVADCEAGFRFWWRDTRLAELPQAPPPSFHFVPSHPASSTNPLSPSKNGPEPQSNRYYFPYPTTFLPVPYHSNTTLPVLDAQIVPAARSVREVPITLPAPIPVSLRPPHSTHDMSISNANGEMDIELPAPSQLSMASDTAFMPTTAFVQPDGLLLYVAEASYEPGTSPLSSWIPIRGYSDEATPGEAVLPEGPLDLFQRLVRRRLSRKILLTSELASNRVAGVGEGTIPSAGDVEMEF